MSLCTRQHLARGSVHMGDEGCGMGPGRKTHHWQGCALPVGATEWKTHHWQGCALPVGARTGPGILIHNAEDGAATQEARVAPKRSHGLVVIPHQRRDHVRCHGQGPVVPGEGRPPVSQRKTRGNGKAVTN